MKATRADVVFGELAHVAGLFFGVPLAMTSDRAEQLRGFLLARMNGEPMAATDIVGIPREERLRVTHGADGVAELTVDGTLTPKAGGMDALSGLVGYDALTAELSALAADESVRGVFVAMESPGGAVAGVSNAVAAMRALRERKPVVVRTERQLASAAYWVASQATKIVAGPDALVGSIGTLMVRRDASQADATAGERWEWISNMERKSDGSAHKPLTDAERTATLAIVSESDGRFFADVHAGRRDLTPDMLQDFDGAVFPASDAKDRKLVDAVGTKADALAIIRTKLRPQQMAGLTRAEGEPMSTEPKGVEEPAKVVGITPEVQAQIDAAVAAATARASLDTQEIVALCARFGEPIARANAFLAEKKTRDEVFAVLQAELVAKDRETQTSGAHGDDPETPKAKTLDPEKYDTHWTTALMAAHAARPPAIVVG